MVVAAAESMVVDGDSDEGVAGFENDIKGECIGAGQLLRQSPREWAL